MVDSRSARQQVAVETWRNTGGRATFEFCTGFGKSYLAIQVAKRLFQNPVFKNAVVHIVCPTLYLQEQFRLALDKSGLQQVEVFVINTYCRESRMCTLLIADEVHAYLGTDSHLFSTLFSICNCRFKLCLSATLTPEERGKLTELGVPVVDTITMGEALANDWVSPHRQYNIAVQLNAEERRTYDAAHKILTTHFAKFGGDFQLAMGCLSNPHVRRKHSEFMGWKDSDGKKHLYSPQSLGTFAVLWHRAMKERKYIVDHCEAKYALALSLIYKFPVPTICFSESTTFASELASRDPDIIRAYHSQMSSTTEEYTVTKTFKTKPDEATIKTKRISGATHASNSIALFRAKDNDVRVLSTARALDQGADFPELRLGIECGGSGTVRQKVQRTGRVVRKDSTATEDNQQAVYVHIYAESTYEKARLKRKQAGMQVQEITDISQITF